MLKISLIFFVSFVFSSCAGTKNKKNITSRDIKRIYVESLDNFFSKKQILNISELNSLMSFYSEITWTKIAKDGNIISMQNGQLGRGLFFVLDREHSAFKAPGPTLVTRKVGKYNGILIRPYIVSDQWAAIFMIHELLHLKHLVNSIEMSSGEDEYLAYKVEKEALNIQTKKKLEVELRNIIKKFKLHGHFQVSWQAKNNSKEFQRAILDMDKIVSKEGAKSESELEMRLGFYTVAIALEVLATSSLNENRKIKAISHLLEEIGKF